MLAATILGGRPPGKIAHCQGYTLKRAVENPPVLSGSFQFLEVNTVIIASAQVPELFEPEAAVSLALEYAYQALEHQAKIICFPEAFLTGYALKENDSVRPAT